MFSSIQVRLWLSYALLIGIILAIVTIGLFVSLGQSPVLYRQYILQLRLAEAEITPQIRGLLIGQPGQIAVILQREAEQRKIRLILIRPNNTILVDTSAADSSSLPPIPRIINPENQDANKDGSFRDSKGRFWIYSQRGLGRGYTLVVTMIRPNLALRTLLRDDVVAPILQTGLIALLFSVIISFLMAKGITGPLKGIVTAAQAMANGQYPAIPIQGPREIRNLAQTLNEMSEKVQSSQQSQRDLIANVSHELKTPLTSIQGFAQAILDGTAQTPESLKQAATVIHTEATRMHRLVMDLLSLAKLEAGTADLQRDRVDIAHLLNQVVDKFSLQAQQVGVNLVKRIPETLVCTGDADRLSQVFINLLDNAIKHTPPGGVIVIQAVAVENNFTVSVKDTGVGIALEDQQRIFERFYQTDKSRRGGTGRGVGLGLAIAHQIVVLHGGKIWVESQPGAGSTFMVQLPWSTPDENPLVMRSPKA